MIEGEHVPYQDIEGHEIDFESKRLAFWLETVPPDLRRQEYDLWRRYRTLVHADLFHVSQKYESLRPIATPPFSEQIQRDSWEEFQKSFLHGDERQERFQDIVHAIQSNKESILAVLPESLDRQDILMMALSGSSFYGPRGEGAAFSDIDVHFLLNRENGTMNFDILPNAQSGKEAPYHLMGTGYTDQARGHRAIHWLLYPHYPVHNLLQNDQMRGIISQLVGETRNRRQGVQEEIRTLDEMIMKESEPNARAWKK